MGEVKVARYNNDFHFGQVQFLQEIYMELVQIILKLIYKANGVREFIGL